MTQLSTVCLSLTPNLRCVSFTLGQSEALIIPPVIEVIISLFFIYLRAQFLLAADATLYFIWALLDMLSHVVPAARMSLSVFKELDFLVGAVSFTPILLYSIYLYRLSFRDFIPTLPRKLQPYLEISLPILLVIAVAINEVSSFVGTHLETSSNQYLVVGFSHDNPSLWLSLSQSSLAIYTIIQFLFFLLAFSRLSRAFLDRRRIELAHSDERQFFRGIAWITIGIIIGVIETIAGFARVSFGVTLARRILRLSARAILMYGLLKGLDIAENFQILTDEPRGVSRISRTISDMLGVNPQRMNMSRRISQSYLEQSRAVERSLAEKQPRDQRVTVQYGKGQAPSLHIRFSTFDFPSQTILADVVQQRRRSLSGLTPGRAGAGSRAQQNGENVSDEMTTTRNVMLEIPRVKSAPAVTRSNHHAPPDRIQPPERVHTRQGSGGTVSDSHSIVRDLERRFPSLPPRVTGKYRGSILGQNYEEDPFPVVGVSRQSSLRQDGNPQSPSEEGGVSVTLSSSGSIKRKPAPPLLENPAYISDRRKRMVSTWGGLTQNTVNHPVDSPVTPNSPQEGTTVYSPDSVLAGEPSTPRSRRTTARDLIKRASRAMSDASIRSAEWLASASAPRSPRAPLTVADIEMYRRGNRGPGLSHPKSSAGEAMLSAENVLPEGSGRSADDARARSPPGQSHAITHISIGTIPMQTTPTPTHAEFDSGCERVSSLYGSVNLNGAQSEVAQRRTTVVPGQQEIGPDQDLFLSD
ncbi:hypothetical protein J3R83DRAFT_13786 [Lanmaoa asiatica]|nr:hypothetical protein J3R83DRAFT_13786 [Lanmaoa asiatica]